jgi:hypothetical protein
VEGGILKPVGAQRPEEAPVLPVKHSWTTLVPDSPLFTRGDLRERVMTSMLGCMTADQKEADAKYDKKRKDLILPETTHGTMKVLQMTADHVALVRSDCPYKEVIDRAKLSPAEKMTRMVFIRGRGIKMRILVHFTFRGAAYVRCGASGSDW